jgi:SAM-dependent MidA family methyltransferase
MGSSDTPPPAAEAGFLPVFRAHADRTGAMSFARFMELALYHPEAGYYRRPGPRVGYGSGTNFFTASTSGPMFGGLVAAACIDLLAGRDPRDYTFVEIGSETDQGILEGVMHPFAAIRCLRVGASLSLEGRCIVFSNELFDAQPFRRFVFRSGAWRERGVALQDGRLVETDFAGAAPAGLPASAPEGYRFDAPLGAAALAREIASQPWTGIFVACDYGRTFRELAENCPAGTARAYYRHVQSNDLLDRPGGQDLTCHICWDWLAAALTDQGFAVAPVASQEAFFVHHAAGFIARTTAAEASGFSRKKLSLLQLLHPSHLGQKFQVLHAMRGEGRP